jgi:hypothetical protein
MIDPGTDPNEFRKKASALAGRIAEGAKRSSDASTGYLPVRQHPKGTRLVAQTDTSVTLRFKAVIRFWWKAVFLMFVLCALSPFLGAGLGLLAAAAEAEQSLSRGVLSRNGSGIVTTWTVMTPLAVIALTILVFRLTRPWVEVYADRDHIRVGDQSFDRRHYGGMRLGYEIQTSDGMLKNDFHDLDIGLQGLRLVYGPWGEDLPYLVNKYHANEIVLWLNFKIGETAAPAPNPVAESGARSHSF